MFISFFSSIRLAILLARGSRSYETSLLTPKQGIEIVFVVVLVLVLESFEDEHEHQDEDEMASEFVGN